MASSVAGKTPLPVHLEGGIGLKTRKKRWPLFWGYPKLFFLTLSVIVAYIVFSDPLIYNLVNHLNIYRYPGIFIAGVMFSFGFTAPFAAGFFIVLKPINIWLAAAVGGLGALLTDLIIFKVIRFSFASEFERLRNTHAMHNLSHLFDGSLMKHAKVYLLYFFAGLLIASPLPDEMGVILLAGLTKINPKIFAVVSFALNTLGILILLSL